MIGADLSQWIVDAAIVVVVIEIAIVLLGNLRSRGVRPWHERVPNLAAGLFLMLGIRTALVGATWPWQAACLTAAGIAHVIDVLARRSGRN